MVASAQARVLLFKGFCGAVVALQVLMLRIWRNKLIPDTPNSFLAQQALFLAQQTLFLAQQTLFLAQQALPNPASDHIGPELMTQPMPELNERPFTEWTHSIGEVTPQGRDFERSTGVEDKEKVAAELGLSSCDEIGVRYRLTLMKDGRVELKGRLHARYVQSCIITLDPVSGLLDEPLKAVFGRLEGASVSSAKGDQKILGELESEPIVDDVIDVGRYCFEVISSAIDPYPKSGDVTLEGGSVESLEAGSNEPAGPFAVLGQLKDKQKRD